MSEQFGESEVELHLFSPAESSVIIELLTVVAHFHCTRSPIGVEGTTVNFGRGWMKGSRLTHGLVSLPYRDGQSLEILENEQGQPLVRCLWLLPITESERDFKKEFGLESLETLFDEQGIDIADPDRPSVLPDLDP